MQKYTNGILPMHINTLHGLHSHYASSFRTNFLQTDTKVEIEKNRRERSSTKHVVLASDSLPKKLGCKNKTVSQQTHLCFHIYLPHSKKGKSEQGNGDAYRMLDIL